MLELFPLFFTEVSDTELPASVPEVSLSWFLLFCTDMIVWLCPCFDDVIWLCPCFDDVAPPPLFSLPVDTVLVCFGFPLSNMEASMGRWLL